MNSDNKLECLRLAVDSFNKELATSLEMVERAQIFYHWVYETNEKPNKLTFEKTASRRQQERE